MEKVVGEQGLALQQHFPCKSSKFSENFKCCINLLFNSRGVKLGQFGIFDALFFISGILQVIAHNMKIFWEKFGHVTPAATGLWPSTL